MTNRYCTLEIDIKSGKRGSRHELVSDLLCDLTGAESAIVVNNNAAAVMLILHALAYDHEVIISRGQLVEIGGSFRMPDVMAGSGAKLVSVGLTNRTELADYEEAITEKTALILDVHRSNFDIIGQQTSVGLDKLVDLGIKHALPVVYDQGSGSLVDLSNYGLGNDPTVPQSVKSGVNLTCFSGDKLLGGPQAGIIVGEKHLIDRLKKDPLMRALRVDKMVFAALHATLELYLRPESLSEHHPVFKMISEPLDDIKARALKLADLLRHRFGSTCEITLENCFSEIGGGALPIRQLPSIAVAITINTYTIHKLAEAFRHNRPCIFGRLVNEQYQLDMRTVLPDDLPHIDRAASVVADSLTNGTN